jgi:hypothetical protein
MLRALCQSRSSAVLWIVAHITDIVLSTVGLVLQLVSGSSAFLRGILLSPSSTFARSSSVPRKWYRHLLAALADIRAGMVFSPAVFRSPSRFLLSLPRRFPPTLSLPYFNRIQVALPHFLAQCDHTAIFYRFATLAGLLVLAWTATRAGAETQTNLQYRNDRNDLNMWKFCQVAYGHLSLSEDEVFE